MKSLIVCAPQAPTGAGSAVLVAGQCNLGVEQP